MRQAAPNRPIDANGRPIPVRVPRAQPPRRQPRWLAIVGYAALAFRLRAGRRRDVSAGRRAGRSHSRPGDRTGQGTHRSRPGGRRADQAHLLPAVRRCLLRGLPGGACRHGRPALAGGAQAAGRAAVVVAAVGARRRTAGAHRGSGDRAARRCAGTAQLGLCGLAGSAHVASPRPATRANDAASDMRLPSSERSRAGLLPASNLQIADATVRYLDERSGTSQEVSRVGYGSGRRRCRQRHRSQRRVGLDGREDRLRSEGCVTPAGRTRPRFPCASRAGRSRPPTTAASRLAGSLEADGALNLRAASWAELVRWLGKQRVTAPETGALAVSARVAAANRRIALNDLSATLGDRSLTGAITVERGAQTACQRPAAAVRARLPAAAGAAALIRARQRRHGCRSDRRSAAGQRQRARPGPQVRGFAKRAAKGWSDEIIDLAPLGLADADLALSVDRLVYKNVTTGRSRLELGARRIAWRRSTLEDVQLYSGRARGVLTLDGRGADGRHNDQPDAGRRVGAAAAERRPGVWLARRTRHDRPLARRAGPLRAADRRDLARQGGAVASPRAPSSAWTSAGCSRGIEKGRFSELKHQSERQDALQRVRRLVRRRQRRCPEPGSRADQPASARERLGLRQSRAAPGRLHRAPEDRGEPDR